MLRYFSTPLQPFFCSNCFKSLLHVTVNCLEEMSVFLCGSFSVDFFDSVVNCFESSDLRTVVPCIFVCVCAVSSGLFWHGQVSCCVYSNL